MTREVFERAFVQAFEDAWTSLPAPLERFAISKQWTPIMLGTPPLDKTPGVLGAAALSWARDSGWPDTSLHAQWYTLDLCAVTPAYAGDRPYWQGRTLIAIEHEHGYDVETEMWKLAHWRAELSVLAFYDFAATALDDTPCGDPMLSGVTKREWLTQKLAQLSAVVRQVNAASAGRHVLLIGQRDGASVVWRSSGWTPEGFAAPRKL